VSQATFDATCIYPIVLAGGGLLGCVLGLGYAAFRKMGDNPSKELNLATWISAGITIVVGFFSALLVFGKVELPERWTGDLSAPYTERYPGPQNPLDAAMNYPEAKK